MVEILSQGEIDALLASLAGEEVGGATSAGGSPGVPTSKKDERKIAYESYDFRRPDKFSKDQLRSLQMVHETFARLFATSLSAYLRVSTHVDLVSVEQIPYEEYMRSLTSSIINIFSMAVTDSGEPTLNGQALLEMEFNICLSMIDRLLGGPGNMVKATKVLTEIEKALIESIIQRALKELKVGWEGIAPLSLTHEAMETQAQFVQIVPPNDVVVSILFEIKFGELRGAMSLCIPYLHLKPILSKLSTQRWFMDKSQAGGHALLLSKRISTTPVTCVCRLGTAHITVNQLYEMKPGDILTLDRRCNDEVEILVGERVKFRGKPGHSGRKLAVHINRAVHEETLPSFR